jgi:peroxiredoxin
VAKLAAGLAILTLVAISGVRWRARSALPLDSPAPALRLPDLAGSTTDLARFRGRLVVLNFWASWCAPCVHEMPSLEGLHRALGPEGLVVVGVSVDDDEGALRRFVEEQGITFPVLWDPGGRQAAAVFGTLAFPTTFVIDRDGILRRRYVGPTQWDAPSALEYFRKLMEGAMQETLRTPASSP